MLVHRAREIVQLTVNAQKRPVKVPGVAWLRPSLAELAGEIVPKPEAPLAYALVADNDAPFHQISTTSRRLRRKTWHGHIAWLMISAGKRYLG